MSGPGHVDQTIFYLGDYCKSGGIYRRMLHIACIRYVSIYLRRGILNAYISIVCC